MKQKNKRHNHFIYWLLDFWEKLTASWRIHLEKPTPVKELAKSREAASIPSFGYFFLLINSAILATLGLLLNSAAVIIGAMIVAPLMNPILSMSFAIVTSNWTLYKRSIVTVALGASTTVLVAFSISSLVPINIAGSEIITRTIPNLLDLGIAISAGAVGSFALTRLSIATSVAGVAIAVALVPPLCVVGIGLGIGSNLATDVSSIRITNLTVSEGAFLLFAANLTGITFSAGLILLSQGYGGIKQSFQALTVWTLIMVLLFGPLSNSLKEVYLINRVHSEIRQLRMDHPEISSQTQVRHVDVNLEGNVAYITVLVTAPKGLLTDEYLQSADERIFKSITRNNIKAVDLEIRIVPIEIKKYKSIR